VWCTELEGQGRSWSAQTDADGHAPLALPDSPLRCVVQPPGHRLDLAAARVEASGPDALGVVELLPGQEVHGLVEIATSSDTEPGAFAIVRVVAADGALIGTALADD